MTITTEEATQGLFKLAQRVPFNIAPEKSERLAADIFGSGKWTIRPSRTEANFYAVPQETALYLPYAGLASLWCLSHVALHLSDIASQIQREPGTRKATSFEIDPAAVLQLGEHLAYARILFHHDQEWPSNLATPDATAPLQTEQGLVNNLFFGALGWIMLHEIAHVHHRDEAVIPHDQLVKQEYRADDFATRWILDEAGAGLENENRILMICVALTWLFLHERVKGKGSTHPATILRLREVVQHFKTSDRSLGLENSGYVLKVILDPETNSPVQGDPKEFFFWVASRLEILFPV